MAAANQVLQPNWIGLTTALVSAYIANNRVPLSELPALITGIHASLTGLANPLPEQAVLPVRLSPAQVRKSITPDGLISFEDGRSYKTLRRHLKQHGLTPAAYRTKWGLPDDYPMTAPSYSNLRSEFARAMRLGHKPLRAAARAT